MSLTPRHFRGEVDVPKIKDFLTGRQYWDRLPDYWNTGKSTVGIYLTLFWSEPSSHLLWEDQNGQVQAYTWLSFEANPRFGGETQAWRILIHPDQRHEALSEEMLLQAESQLKAKSKSGTLKTVAYETDTWLASFSRPMDMFERTIWTST